MQVDERELLLVFKALSLVSSPIYSLYTSTTFAS